MPMTAIKNYNYGCCKSNVGISKTGPMYRIFSVNLKKRNISFYWLILELILNNWIKSCIQYFKYSILLIFTMSKPIWFQHEFCCPALDNIISSIILKQIF